jgi:hypothetical protein
MKVISIRMPDELAKALRKRAAEETITRDRRVSINELVVEILQWVLSAGIAKAKSPKAIKADRKAGKKGGDR